MNTLEKIGQLIKLLRVGRGLSQEQFCNQCGIDQHYISNIENGQRNLSIAFVEKIALYFSMSLSQFFAEVDNIVDSHPQSPVIISGTTRERFVSFMQSQGLSERTIGKYSNDTPNSHGVQQIILSVTGRTDDMYHVHNISDLETIIERVQESEFDQTGHSLYSAGLKKFKLFLESQ